MTVLYTYFHSIAEEAESMICISIAAATLAALRCKEQQDTEAFMHLLLSGHRLPIV